MRLIRLKNSTDNFFKKAWELYEDAFPIEERRTLDKQLSVLQNDRYHFDIVIDNDQFIGFIFWWNFNTFRFIEYFATAMAHRNKGIGKLILNNFIDCDDKPIILEVELPTSNINERRIKFYERLGFNLNQHYYEVPNAIKNKPPLQLLLMSYPDHIALKDVDLFIKNVHPLLFNN